MSRLSDLEEPRQSSTLAKAIEVEPPVFIQLSYKSLLRRQIAVQLFCSDLNSPKVSRSWISVPDSENLVWEMEDDRKVSNTQRYKLSLNKIVSLSELSASEMSELEQCTTGLVGSQVLKLVTLSKHLIVIFNDTRQAKEWQDAFSSLLKKPGLPGVRKNLLGNIYDISELEKNSVRMWREMKVTFVRHDNSSAEEFLVYDTTQDDLDDSLKEVLHATADKTDVCNSEILKQYLLDVTALEELRRTKERTSVVGSPENLTAYNGVNHIETNQRLFKTIQKSQNSSNDLTKVYRLMLAQKYSQTVKLATIATIRQGVDTRTVEERKADRAATHLRKWERDLSANVAKVRESMERQREAVAPSEEARPRTCFREACECRVF